MIRRKIHIDNLKIKLPRGMAGEAKSIAAGIGSDVMRSIAEATSGKNGSIRIDEISAGKLRTSGGAGTVQKQAAAQMANAAIKRISGGGK